MQKERFTEERLTAFYQQGQDLVRNAVNRYFPEIKDVFTCTPEFSVNELGKMLTLFLVFDTHKGKLGLLITKYWDVIREEADTILDLSLLGENDCRFLEEERVSILKARIINRTAIGEGALDEDLRIRWEDLAINPQISPSRQGMETKEELIRLAYDALEENELIVVLEKGLGATDVYKTAETLDEETRNVIEEKLCNPTIDFSTLLRLTSVLEHLDK